MGQLSQSVCWWVWKLYKRDKVNEEFLTAGHEGLLTHQTVNFTPTSSQKLVPKFNRSSLPQRTLGRRRIECRNSVKLFEVSRLRGPTQFNNRLRPRRTGLANLLRQHLGHPPPHRGLYNGIRTTISIPGPAEEAASYGVRAHTCTDPMPPVRAGTEQT